jgi:hypothetical protein
MSTLDWKLREALPHLRDNGRLNVLIALILRANVRNRCYPSMRVIAKDTGYGLEAITGAKKWLEEHGAIELVPVSKRIGDEKKIRSNRQHVYQLTGMIEIDGFTYPYFYVSPTETEVVKDSKDLKKRRKDSVASDDARTQGASSESTPSLKPTDSNAEATTPPLPQDRQAAQRQTAGQRCSQCRVDKNPGRGIWRDCHTA